MLNDSIAQRPNYAVSDLMKTWTQRGDEHLTLGLERDHPSRMTETLELPQAQRERIRGLTQNRELEEGGGMEDELLEITSPEEKLKE